MSSPAWVFEAEEFVDFAVDEGLRLRGHTLLWGIDDGHMWLDDEEYSPFWTRAPHEPLLLDAHLNKKPAYFAVRERLAQRTP